MINSKKKSYGKKNAKIRTLNLPGKENKMTKFCQIYKIKLLNGEVIESAEDYDLPVSKGLVGTFERMKETDILTVNDILLGSAYIPKKSILYIATGDVREVLCFGSKNK